MLKNIKILLVAVLVLILCAGCSQKDAPYISNEYVLEYEDDKCFMSFLGERNDEEIDLLENEIIDSLAFIELISSLENEFNIEIQPTQVDPNTWRSINSIIDLVKS